MLATIKSNHLSFKDNLQIQSPQGTKNIEQRVKGSQWDSSFYPLMHSSQGGRWLANI